MGQRRSSCTDGTSNTGKRATRRREKTANSGVVVPLFAVDASGYAELLGEALILVRELPHQELERWVSALRARRRPGCEGA